MPALHLIIRIFDKSGQHSKECVQILMCVTHGQMFFRNAAEVVEGCQGSRPSSKQSILYLLQGFCCRLLVFNNCTCLLDRIFNLSNQTLKKACQQSGSFGVLSLQI